MRLGIGVYPGWRPVEGWWTKLGLWFLVGHWARVRHSSPFRLIIMLIAWTVDRRFALAVGSMLFLIEMRVHRMPLRDQCTKLAHNGIVHVLSL